MYPFVEGFMEQQFIVPRTELKTDYPEFPLLDRIRLEVPTNERPAFQIQATPPPPLHCSAPSHVQLTASAITFPTSPPAIRRLTQLSNMCQAALRSWQIACQVAQRPTQPRSSI